MPPGRKTLVCAGGANSQSGFEGATTVANLPTLISNLTSFMTTNDYDGIDLDWEPFTAVDIPQFTNLVNGLRSALNGLPQPKLLTAATMAYPPYGDPPDAGYTMFATLQNQFDQINIMTYDMSGPWLGWVTWFNSPIYNGGYRFASGGLVPSVDESVSNYVSHGVTPGKLGLGVAFYGCFWTGGPGVWQPRQSWPTNNAPTVTQQSYHAIMSSYYQTNLYQWDASAQAAYLSVTNINPSNDLFISYDEPRTCRAKISYARNHGLGGLMIWEVAQDYFPTQPIGQRNPLMQAIKQGLATPTINSIELSNQVVSLSFTSLPLGSYRVTWSGDLAGNLWNTLAITNATEDTGVTKIIDASPPPSPRYYRVQTPP